MHPRFTFLEGNRKEIESSELLALEGKNDSETFLDFSGIRNDLDLQEIVAK
jgi:hypothetical protein